MLLRLGRNIALSVYTSKELNEQRKKKKKKKKKKENKFKNLVVFSKTLKT